MAALGALDLIMGRFDVLDFFHDARNGFTPQRKIPTAILTTYL
jgi:hypothetical protein